LNTLKTLLIVRYGCIKAIGVNIKHLFEIEFEMKEELPEHAEPMNVSEFLADHLRDLTKHHDGTTFMVKSVRYHPDTTELVL